tara:strand:- start:19 stop:402 length:384 start_codon:yes stop_codon:yes gene_type:complete
MQDFTHLNFTAFMPLTDEYAVSVSLMNPYFGWGSDYPDKTLYEIGVMRLINKETEEYELEQDGPNYYDVMLYLEEDEVTKVMEMIQNSDYTHYNSRISTRISKQRWKKMMKRQEQWTKNKINESNEN